MHSHLAGWQWNSLSVLIYWHYRCRVGRLVKTGTQNCRPDVTDMAKRRHNARFLSSGWHIYLPYKYGLKTRLEPFVSVTSLIELFLIAAQKNITWISRFGLVFNLIKTYFILFFGSFAVYCLLQMEIDIDMSVAWLLFCVICILVSQNAIHVFCVWFAWKLFVRF